MIVGRIAQLWRHPVKSMEGERVELASIGLNGILGDRAWAVRDEERGGIRGAKKIPALMTCKARYVDEPDGAKIPAPEITLPSGELLRADAPDAAERLSAALGHDLTLWPLQPASDLAHYQRGAPDHEDVLTELRAIFGRNLDEPLPDFSQFPPEIMQYESPPGTYFDVHPLNLLTDATLRRLRKVAPTSVLDVRRFRPNLVIETGGEGFVEAGWAGRQLRIGSTSIDVGQPCPRCVMITHGFADVPRDPGLMRAVVREADQNVGSYATVAQPGEIRVGDPVELV
jgi:uncharacterized protein YcbX